MKPSLLCPIKVDRNTIELIMHTSCCLSKTNSVLNGIITSVDVGFFCIDILKYIDYSLKKYFYILKMLLILQAHGKEVISLAFL